MFKLIAKLFVIQIIFLLSVACSSTIDYSSKNEPIPLNPIPPINPVAPVNTIYKTKPALIPIQPQPNKETNKFKINDIALVGFSQGCMMSIQVGLKRKKQINCLIGYSGKVINKKHLSNNIQSKPKIFLMHGANDTIVSPTHLLEAKEYLSKHGLKIKTKLFKNCDHKIPVEGSSLGLGFLRKNLL